MSSTTHNWSREDDMYDRCNSCGLVQGVLTSNHYSAKCPTPKNVILKK